MEAIEYWDAKSGENPREQRRLPSSSTASTGSIKQFSCSILNQSGEKIAILDNDRDTSGNKAFVWKVTESGSKNLTR